MSKTNRRTEILYFGLGAGAATWLIIAGATGDLLTATLIAGGAMAVTPFMMSKLSAMAERVRPLEEVREYASSVEDATLQTQRRPMVQRRQAQMVPARKRYDDCDVTPAQRRVERQGVPVARRQAATQVNQGLAKQLRSEIAQINTTLKALGVNAGTKPQWTQIGGSQMVFYTIKAGPGQKINAIEAALPELSEAISGLRRKQTLVRMLRFPLRLEVEHPFYAPLQWDATILDGQPNEVLIGKTYDNGPGNMRLPMGDNPHILVAGTTGSGKSVLINAMVLSIAWNTSPADLVIYLVDMKNKSLAPLRKLPHVKRFASDVESAELVVAEAGAALDAKIQNRKVADHRQHLLVIDEYADLSDSTAAMETINHIVRMGREDAVNMIIGTQHPTSSVLGKDGTKQNFPVRIVGSVTDASAATVAAGMGGTGAHLLPTKRGAFLVRRGAELTRANTYMITGDDVAATVQTTLRKWGKRKSEPLEPVLEKTSPLLVVEPPELHPKPVLEPVQNRSEPFVEPLSDKRPLSANEAQHVRRLHDSGMSKTALCRMVYGSKNGQYMEWINGAIDYGLQPRPTNDDKIIKLRRSA